MIKPALLRLALLLVLAGAPLLAPAQINSSPPGMLNYQGYLTDASGNPLGNGNPTNYLVQFRLYNSPTANTVLWGEQQVVTVDRGYFTVLLGAGAADSNNDFHTNNLAGLFNAADASSRFLGLTVSTNNEIIPRLQLLSSPYAFLAAQAINASNSASAANATNLVVGGSGKVINSTNVALLAGGNQFSGNQTFNGTLNATNLAVSGPGSFNGTLTANSIINYGGESVRNSTGGTLDLVLGADSTDVTAVNDAVIRSYLGNLFLQSGAGHSAIAITTNNSVGIGIATPGQKLEVNGNAQIDGNLTTRGNVGVGTSANAQAFSVAGTIVIDANAQNTGLLNNPNGINQNTNPASGYGLLFGGPTSGEGIASQRTGTPQYNLSFYTGFNPRVTILSNGQVGIGTTTPTQAQLVVNGTGAGGLNNASQLEYVGYASVGNTRNLLGNAYSLYTSLNIWCGGEVDVTSDARIKKIQGHSNGAADLETLIRIEITDYTYRDTIAKGDRPHKKVIAQQVERVFPQAVSIGTDVIPDIYQKAEMKDGWVSLNTDLKVGERVRLIGEKEQGIHEVVEVRPGAFRTAFKPASEQVFVYGREVKDFRNVDYDAVSMLNVSATQELARRLAAREAELAQLRAEKEALAGKVAVLEAREQAREARFARLERRLDEIAIETVQASLERK